MNVVAGDTGATLAPCEVDGDPLADVEPLGLVERNGRGRRLRRRVAEEPRSPSITTGAPPARKRGELGAGSAAVGPTGGTGEAEGQLNGSADGTCEHWPVTAARSSRPHDHERAQDRFG